MRVNDDPKEGVRNLYTIFNSLGSDHVQINSITVEPGTKRQQEFGMADIVELDQEKEGTDLSMEDNEEKTLNILVFGIYCCNCEIM